MTTADPKKSDPSPPGAKPGKTRTLWHPLLERLLTFSLSSAYTVQGEVLVGKIPLRVDILLIRRIGTELPEAKRREVAALVPLLGRFTLMEFKGPTDTLESGDFSQLLGCAFLWYSQQDELFPREDVSLIVLAPRVTDGFRDELHALGCEASLRQNGVYQVNGLSFTVWLVETDTIAQPIEPVLSLVSRVFLRDHASIMKELSISGHSNIANYAVQLIHQLHTHREDFAVPTGISDEFAKLDEELIMEMWASMPELFEKVPPELRLRGLLPEERVRGLSLEERLVGLSDEEKAGLADFAKRIQGN